MTSQARTSTCGEEPRLGGAASLQQPAGLRVEVAQPDRHVLVVGVQPPAQLGIADRRCDRVGVGVAMAGYVDRCHAAIIPCLRSCGGILSPTPRGRRGTAARTPANTREDHAVGPPDPSHADPAGHRARRQLPPRGRARAGAAHGARRPGARVLRAPRAAVEVPQPADRPASAEEGPQAPRVRRHAAAAARGAVAGGARVQPRLAGPHRRAAPAGRPGHRRPRAPVPGRDRRRPVRLQPHQGLREHALRRRLLGRRVLRRRSRGRGLGPRLRQRVREEPRSRRDDRHRARRLGLPRPLGADVAGGLRVQDRLSGRRRRQPRVQPLHRAGARRAAERLLPPAGRRGRGRRRPARGRRGADRRNRRRPARR